MRCLRSDKAADEAMTSTGTEPLASASSGAKKSTAVDLAGQRVVRDLVAAQDPSAAHDDKYQQLFRNDFHGEAPDFGPYMGQHNDAERQLAALLPEVVAFVAERIKANVKDVDDQFELGAQELATTFFAEGGNVWMAKNETTPRGADFVGGTDAVIDTLDQLRLAESLLAQARTPDERTNLSNLAGQMKAEVAAVRPWLHPCVLSDEGTKLKSVDVQPVPSTLRSTLYLLAAEYAYAKSRVSRDYRAIVGRPFHELPAAEQIFWATFYFNSGAGNGHLMLSKRMEDPSSPEWMKRYGGAHAGDGVEGYLPADKQKVQPYFANPYHHSLQRAAAFEKLDPVFKPD